jgi:hypothetical protein
MLSGTPAVALDSNHALQIFAWAHGGELFQVAEPTLATLPRSSLASLGRLPSGLPAEVLLDGGPRVVSHANGFLGVISASGNGTVWMKHQSQPEPWRRTLSSWSEWQEFPFAGNGPLRLAVARTRSDTLVMCAETADHTFHDIWEQGPEQVQPWSEWAPDGASGLLPLKSPVLAVNDTGTLELFVLTLEPDQTVWRKRQPRSGLMPLSSWSEWTRLTPPPAGGPSFSDHPPIAVANQNRFLEVFCVSSAGVYQSSQRPGGHGTTWHHHDLPGCVGAAAVLDNDGLMHLFAVVGPAYGNGVATIFERQQVRPNGLFSDSYPDGDGNETPWRRVGDMA